MNKKKGKRKQEYRNLLRDIKKIKQKLKEKANKEGAYKNFGLKEVNELQNKYSNLLWYWSEEQSNATGAISAFNEWCVNYRRGR